MSDPILRVLVADESKAALEPVGEALGELGHEVIALAVERYRQFRDLLGAFDRRARIERAKGLLMERHRIGEEEAFERLRRQARDTRRPILGVVDDVLG